MLNGWRLDAKRILRLIETQIAIGDFEMVFVIFNASLELGKSLRLYRIAVDRRNLSRIDREPLKYVVNEEESHYFPVRKLLKKI